MRLLLGFMLIHACESFYGIDLLWLFWYPEAMSELKLSKAQAGRLGGLKGGRSTSPAKRRAAKRNGKNGGRPRKVAGAR